MFTTSHLVERLQRRLRREGRKGIALWQRDCDRPYGSPRAARQIVENEPFSDRMTYGLIYDAGSEYVRRGIGVRAANLIARYEEVFAARIAEPDIHLSADELKDLGLRLSLYSCCVDQPALARLGRLHVAVEHVRRLVARFSNDRHRDVLGAQLEPDEMKYLLLGAAVNGLSFWL